MAKISFMIVLLFSLNSHVQAQEKIRLPAYKNWASSQPHFGIYSTIPGCEKKSMKELMLFDRNGIIQLKSSNYRSSNNSDFLDVIYDNQNKPKFIFYYASNETGNTIYLFRRENFFLLGHRWKLIDSLPETLNGETVEDELVISFQIRNCLFFPFK